MDFKVSKNRLKRLRIQGYPFTLEGLLSCLFPATSLEYFEYKCNKELLWINCQPAALTSPIQEHDLIAHLEHVHERPVLDWKLEIIHEDEDVLVVNKPPSLCISPSSTYKFNTLLFILAKEHGYTDLRPVHRLDKKTSGVLILAKSKKSAARIQEYFFSKDVQISKEYVALVEGNFPDSLTCHDPINYFIVNSQSSRKLYHPKECATEFELISSHDGMSLVRAKPLTGRTHQIRIHLRNLGFPIVNDPSYNQSVENDPIDAHQESYQMALRQLAATSSNLEVSAKDSYFSQTCVNCLLGNEYLISMNKKDRMFICLHSWKYKLGDRYEFEAEWPEWAKDASVLRKAA